MSTFDLLRCDRRGYVIELMRGVMVKQTHPTATRSFLYSIVKRLLQCGSSGEAFFLRLRSRCLCLNSSLADAQVSHGRDGIRGKEMDEL